MGNWSPVWNGRAILCPEWRILRELSFAEDVWQRASDYPERLRDKSVWLTVVSALYVVTLLKFLPSWCFGYPRAGVTIFVTILGAIALRCAVDFQLDWRIRTQIRERVHASLRSLGLRYCIRCAYDLRGCDSLCCPECGTIEEPAGATQALNKPDPAGQRKSTGPRVRGPG